MIRLAAGLLLIVPFAASAQCASGVTDNPQTICGAKTFTQPLTVYADVYTDGSMYIGGYVRALTNGQAFVCDGRRLTGDVGAEMTVRETNERAAGGMMLDLRRFGNTSVFGIDNRGNVFVRGTSEGESGTIHDATGIAGHHALTASPRLGLTISGRFGEPGGPCATLPDGGTAPDGGCFPFAGRHGDVTAAATFPRHEGMLQDWQNPQSGIGAYDDKKAFIDFAGGFGQAHGLNRAQFGVCPSELVMVVYPGSSQQFQFRYGHEVSVQLFAFDEQRWYVCTEAGWIGQATSDEIAHLNARLADAGL